MCRTQSLCPFNFRTPFPVLASQIAPIPPCWPSRCVYHPGKDDFPHTPVFLFHLQRGEDTSSSGIPDLDGDNRFIGENETLALGRKGNRVDTISAGVYCQLDMPGCCISNQQTAIFTAATLATSSTGNPFAIRRKGHTVDRNPVPREGT
jgi:hypothetical protein